MKERDLPPEMANTGPAKLLIIGMLPRVKISPPVTGCLVLSASVRIAGSK